MCVCVCVCKSSMLMLPNICGGRHAWECVWTCIRVCVYVRIRHQSRGKPVCKVICMLTAEQQSYSPRGYKPRWMWNKQLLLPKAAPLVSMWGPNESIQICLLSMFLDFLHSERSVSRDLVSQNLILLPSSWCKHLRAGALNLARWAQLTQASTDILDSR